MARHCEVVKYLKVLQNKVLKSIAKVLLARNCKELQKTAEKGQDMARHCAQDALTSHDWWSPSFKVNIYMLLILLFPAKVWLSWVSRVVTLLQQRQVRAVRQAAS